MAQNKHKIPISGYNPRTKELFFSWSSSQSSTDIPDRTIVFNLEYGHSSYIDHGFTAMINYQSYNQMSLRDFLVETIVDGENYSICDCDSSVGDIMQGDPYVMGRTSSTANYDNLWKTNEAIGTCDPAQYTDEWNCVANGGEWTPTSADDDSLCKKLGSRTFHSFCEEGTEGSTFVMASSEDYFLKEYSPDYYKRDIHTPVDGSTAHYVSSEYESVLESGAMHFETDNEKTLQRITLEYSGITSDSVTAVMKFGKANQPDLLLTGAAYTALNEQELLSYQSSAATSDIEGNLISPDDKAYFNNYTRGRYIGYQLKLTGAGAVTLSRLTLSTRLAEK